MAKALVISDYRPTLTVRPEAEIFIGMAGLGVDITIMTFAESEYVEKFRKAGIKIIDFHPEKKLDKKEINYIKEELIRGQYDILHLFNNPAIINGIQAAKKLAVKVVLYRGSAGHINWYDPISHLKFLHSRVDKIVCNSKGVEEYIHQQLFFDKSKTVTINKGHLLEWYDNVQATNLQNYGIPENAFTIICVANNRKVKGIPYLLKAMDLLPENSNIHLILIGKNMVNAKNKKIISNSLNKNKVHFLDFKEKPLEFVAASDVFVLASLERESLTKAVMEAMALGIAPIITNLPGNRELVTDGENGLIIPTKNPKAIADAILKLYHNKDLRIKFGRNSKEKIREKLNNKVSILKTKELYEELSTRY